MTESRPHIVLRVRSVLGALWLACGLLFFPAVAFSAIGDVISVFSPPGGAPWGMAWDGANLWIVDRSDNRIYEVTTTGTVLSSFVTPDNTSRGLTWDGTNLRLSDNVTDLIYEINTTGTVLSSFPSVGPTPLGLTWDGVNLWVVQHNLGSMYEMTTTGAVVSSFPIPVTPQVGVTWDGTNLWLTKASTIEEWTTTGTLLSSFASPCTNTRGITFDGTNFWIACDGGGPNDFIYQLEGPGASFSIVKRAFWADGTPIPSGATIPSGVGFKYLLYINNQDIARSDVSVRDVLDPAFQYQAGTIQADNSVAECAAAVCTVADEQTIFTAVDGAAFLSDAVDGDIASYTGASLSVDAGDGNVANAQLNINADAVWAVLFSVKMP